MSADTKSKILSDVKEESQNKKLIIKKRKARTEERTEQYQAQSGNKNSENLIHLIKVLSEPAW